MTAKPASRVPAPTLAIGGVGGSGTRLIAEMATKLGFGGGEDINGSGDNLWHTLLFKQREVVDLAPSDVDARAAIFIAAMGGERGLTADERSLVLSLAEEDRPEFPREWLQRRAESLLRATATARPRPARWAWKEPNTHIVLRDWRRVLPDLRYVHVVRNGLDMAFSGNQNQRALWGEWLLGRPLADTPRDSLAYWCAAHRRVAAIAAGMGPDFLWLDFEQLCRDPESGLVALADFAGVARDDALALRPLVGKPTSIGRGHGEPLEQFDPADLDYLRTLGHLD